MVTRRVRGGGGVLLGGSNTPLCGPFFLACLTVREVGHVRLQSQQEML